MWDEHLEYEGKIRDVCIDERRRKPRVFAFSHILCVVYGNVQYYLARDRLIEIP